MLMPWMDVRGKSWNHTANPLLCSLTEVRCPIIMTVKYSLSSRKLWMELRPANILRVQNYHVDRSHEIFVVFTLYSEFCSQWGWCTSECHRRFEQTDCRAGQPYVTTIVVLVLLWRKFKWSYDRSFFSVSWSRRSSGCTGPWRSSTDRSTGWTITDLFVELAEVWWCSIRWKQRGSRT